MIIDRLEESLSPPFLASRWPAHSVVSIVVITIAAVFAFIPLIIVTTIISAVILAIIVIAAVVSTTVIMASITISTVPLSVVPVRPAASQQQRTRNGHEHYYCTLHLNVLNAKVSDMTVRPLNDSLVRYIEVQNAKAQKMVDIGEEMPGPMTSASAAKLRGKLDAECKPLMKTAERETYEGPTSCEA